MKKKNKNEFEVIYFGDEEIIIEEDKRKKYPFFLFFFKYGRLITMLFATISILTFIGGVALTLSSIPKINNPEDINTTTVMEFDGTDNNVNANNSRPITQDYAEKLFDNSGKNNNNPYMKVTNIINVGNDKVIYFENGSAVIIYGNKNKLPIYVANSNNVIIDNNNKNIKVNGETVSTIKKTVLPDGMIVYEFANDKIMTELNDVYKLYDKDKGNPINIVKVGNDKIVYFDNSAAVVVYNNPNKMPDYVDNMENVLVNNNNININGNKIEATSKKTLPNSTTIYDFPNKKSMSESKDKDNYKLYDTDSIIYDKDGNIKDSSNNQNGNGNVGTPNKEQKVGDDLVLYFDNGSAVIIYADKTKNPVYIPNKNNVNTSKIPVSISGNKVDTINKKTLPDGTIIYEFANDKALIEKNGEYELVDKNNIEYDDNGNLKDNNTSEDMTFKEFNVKNNSNEKLKYRIVVEETKDYGNKEKLLPQYIYQKVSIDGNKQDSVLLNKNPWPIGSQLEDALTINNNTYILYEGEIAAQDTDKIKLALWTDYETIPNDMQDKWFIGTIKLYSWQ